MIKENKDGTISRTPPGLVSVTRSVAAEGAIARAKAVLASSVDHPRHYNGHRSGVECIEVVRHLDFDIGNAFKYVFRAGSKGSAIEDLDKALWYINDTVGRVGPIRPPKRIRKAGQELVNRIADSEEDPDKAEALRNLWLAATASTWAVFGKDAHLGIAAALIEKMRSQKGSE